MAFTLGDANLLISPQLVSGFDTVLTNQVQGVVNKVSERLGSIGAELTSKLTVPLAIGLTANLTQFAGLDAKLQETATLFSAVGDRATRFTDEFRRGVAGISDQVGLFERDIAPALYQAISAGIPRNNVFEFLDVAARAAVGGVTDIQTTVNGLTTAVNAFASQGLTAEKAADVLFRGVARGKTTFGELSQEMATAAPLAAAAGVQFEEFVAIIATMALSGTTTSEAITQMRAAINGILRPSEEMTAIFSEAGYESAGLAVQQIGLQKALGLVVTATRGETGELIKLLGGAEAANGALQITGDNAQRFESIFRDTSNATGAANAAFVTMSKTASQTFKNLFVQLDRFGSTMGEIAFTVIGPVTRALTGFFSFINKGVDAFSRWPDTVQALAGGFVTLLAAIGPVLLIASKLVSVFGVSMALQLSKSGKLVGALGGGLRVLASGLALSTGRALQFLPPVRNAGIALQALGKRGLEPLTTSLKGGAGAFGLITLAVTAAVVAFELYQEHARRTADAAKFATIGAEKLADSLGLVVKPAEALQALSPINMEFRLENLDAIASLEQVKDDVDALEGRLILIAYELVQLGNTPEEAIDAIRKLADEANIDVPINVTTDELTFENLREGILAEMQRIQDLIPTLGIGEDPFNTEVFGDFFFELDSRVLNTRGSIQHLGELVAGVFHDVGLEASIGLLRELNVAAGDNLPVINTLNDAFLRGLNATNPELQLAIGGFTDVNDVVSELYRRAVITGDQLKTLPATAEALVGPIVEVTQAFTAEQTTEQIGKMIGGMGELRDTVGEVSQRIVARLGEIQAELVGQIPLWGEYKGAADLSVNAVIASLDRYDAAVIAWSETSHALFGEIPELLREQLNQLPIEQRAALARLAEKRPAEFDRLIAEYEESFNLMLETGETAWKDELPALIEEGNIEIAAKARELEREFGIIGTNVATVWRTNFERIAATWAASVSHFAGLAVAAFPDFGSGQLPFMELDPQGRPRYPAFPATPPAGYVPLPPRVPFNYIPTGGIPDYAKGGDTYSYEYNYEYNITPGPGGSVPREVEKILGITRTQELLNRVYQN